MVFAYDSAVHIEFTSSMQINRRAAVRSRTGSITSNITAVHIESSGCVYINAAAADRFIADKLTTVHIKYTAVIYVNAAAPTLGIVKRNDSAVHIKG